MSIRASLATGFLVAAVASGGASAAGNSMAALVQCGTLTAGGKSWHVFQASVSCRTARSVVRQVLAAKPDRVIHASGGEIDQYKASFSGFRCFKTRKAGVGGQVQCGANDQKRTIIAMYKG